MTQCMRGRGLAVSTLGLPDGTPEDLVGLCARHGVTGVELRAAEGQPVHTGLDAARRAQVRRRLEDAGLDVLCVASYVKACVEGDDDAVVAEGVAHLELAADLGAQAVRVFPGGVGDPGVDDARGRRRLAALQQRGDALGVSVLLETHDSHPRSADALRLLDGLDGVGVIWDVLHTWRAGERPADVLATLGERLAYVQVKDARPPRESPTLVLPGEGEALSGVREALAAYDGWVSLEWELPWHPQLPPLDVALAATRSWLS